MELKEFIAKLEKMNFSLSVKEGNLLLKGDKTKLSTAETEAIKSNTEVIDFIKEHKDKLIDYLTLFPELSSKKSKDIVSVYKLSSLQQGMLFHGLYDNSGSYIEQFGFDVVNINTSILLASWDEVIKNHSILRSAFFHDAFSIPVQCVFRNVKLPVEELDYRGIPTEAQKIALKEYELVNRARGFDYKTPPLIRLGLIRLAENRYRMFWTSHHLLFDGWSLPVMMEEFLTTYELLLSGKPLPTIQEDKYEDYIRFLERKDKNAEEAYWRNYLQGVTRGTLLPFVRSAERTKVGGTYDVASFTLNHAVTARIYEFVKAHHVTINTLMQGIWAWLLHKYTNETDVIYGAIVSGRPPELQNVEKRVGMFINTLPFRAVFDENADIVTWLQSLQIDQVSSRQYQNTGLQDIKDWIGIKGDLFDSILVIENYPVNKLVSSAKWSLKIENVEFYDQNNYPLTVAVSTSEELGVSFTFNTDILDKAYILNIRDQFEHVLLQITGSSAITIHDIQLLTQAQEQAALYEFNNTLAPYPADKSIVEMFELRVKDAPGTAALVFGKVELTYAELNDRANQLARFLTGKGIRAETLVPICIERGPLMIIAIMGILKAGGAYVPIDPDYPHERIVFMLDDTKAGLVLSSKECSAKIPSAVAAVIALDEDLDEINTLSTDNIALKPNPANLAYVIFTSGSTGQPKGVLIEHGGVVNLAVSQARDLQLKPGMRTLQFASFGFDASCYEIFNTLLSGGCLVLCTKEDLLSAEGFSRLVANQKVEVAVLPTSFQQTINNSTIAMLRTVVSAGEALNEATALNMLKLGVRVINAYGPTETTVCASLSDEPIRPNNLVTIGKPIANTQIYILNGDETLCAAGVTGEICVAGAGLARGYLNRPQLTTEKFIPNPFNNKPGATLYKTGDLGRWLPDGNIEYVGRIDDQVKIRGYRIELGEIESVLNSCEYVSLSVVLAKEDKQGNKRLIGYVVPAGKFNRDAIEDYLAAKLPDYMVPGLWVEMERMPLTMNEKIDRKALPDPETITKTAGSVAARNETEEKLKQIWEEVLEIDNIGVDDDFFDIGGHSLLAIRMISAIRKAFGSEIPINDVFDYPTIALLATRLTVKPTEERLALIEKKSPRPHHIPLSFSQERLWFIDRLEGSIQYHLPAVLRIKGSLNKKSLDAALREVINRHEVLRSVILEHEGIGYQHIRDAANWALGVKGPSDYNNDSAFLPVYIQGLTSRPFDLSLDYMLRADLISIDPQDHLLVITLHHIASDGWSTSIMVKEVIEIYSAYIENRLPEVAVLPIQYADYAIWQRNYMQGDVLEKKLSYWENKLANVSPIKLPVDYSRPVVMGNAGTTYGFTIPKELYDGLLDLSHTHGATLFITLLSAFNVLLYRYSGQNDICVGTPVAGRQQQEVEGLIGFFVNTLALRNNVSDTITFAELLSEIKNTTLEAYNYQDVPFEKIVDTVVKTRDMSRSPLFQVLFSLQNTPAIPELRLGETKLYTEYYGYSTSAFDLSLFLSESTDGLRANIEYSTELYQSETIERMAQHYMMLLDAIVADPYQKVGLLQLVNLAENQRLMHQFNNTYVNYPTDKTVVALFEEQAAKTPDNVALIFQGTTLSYNELNQQANRLANYLRSIGVETETLVPLCTNRGFDMIIGILGIMKAGGAYVPIDPEFPQDRIDHMLDDIQASFIVLNENVKEKFSSASAIIINLDGDNKFIGKQSVQNLSLKPSIHQLAYVMYTSGSTGRPKGVMIEHGNLLNYSLAFKNYCEISETDRVLQQSSVSFDTLCEELYPSLISGAGVIIVKEGGKDIDSIKNHIENEGATMLCTTPTVVKWLNKELTITGALRYIVSGGEAMSVLHINNLYSKVKVINNYGPTEATVCVTFNKIDNLDKASLIGKPIANTKIYILDNNRQLLPIGIPGEICIGGSQVARGYLNRPELTADKFIKDVFSDDAGSRLYRTGDMGRWLEDGNIEYLGRIDDQLKVRGYRIEPGEVENVLEHSGMIKHAVVTAKDDANGNKRLIAYVITERDFDKGLFIEYLQSKLPDYMIPAVWIPLDSMPLTANGKVDKKALPDPEVTVATTTYVAPRNDTESALAEIWQELLNVERVGVYDNFFELGGHSLLAMRVAAYIERKLQVSVAIHVLFQFATINDLSKYIEIKIKPSSKVENNTSFKFLDV